MTQLQDVVNIVGPLLVASGLALVVLGLVLGSLLNFLDTVSIFDPEVGFLFVSMGIIAILGGIVLFGLKAVDWVSSTESSKHRRGR